MPRTIVATGLAFLLCSIASCATGTYADTSFSTATVEIVEIDPEPESTIDRSTKLSARIRYSINDFKSDDGRYELSITFAATTLGNTFRTHDVNEGREKVNETQGEIDLSYRLSSLRERENLQLANPVQVRFIVTERSGPKGSTKIIGLSDFVTFPMEAR